MKTVGTAVLAGSLRENHAGQKKLPSIVVDTHTHFYDPTREGGVPWPPKNSQLYRTVLPEDWLAVAKPNGVTHTIIVEASSWVEDNQWILDQAQKHTFILGVIGNLKPDEPEFAKHLERFAKNPLFKGIRVSAPMLLAKGGSAEFLKGIRLLAEKELVLEVNGNYTMLPPIEALASQFPSLTIVADHVGGAGDAQLLKPEWHAGMESLRKHKKVFCKVSGIPGQSKAEWGKAPKELEYYLPIFHKVWEVFGEDRLFYGSDWPVSDKGVDYRTMFEMVVEYFAGKKDSERVLRKLFQENSQKAYRWSLREKV